MNRLLAAAARWSCRSKTESPATTALLVVVAVGMAGLHIAQTFLYFLPGGQFKNLHLGLALLITMLGFLEVTPRERRWTRRALSAGALLSLVPLLYIHIEYQALISTRSFFPDTADLVVAGLLLVLVCLAAAREWGWTMPGLAIAALLYGRYGGALPGELFSHANIGWPRLLGYTSIPYFQGMLGELIELSAGTIFMFMVFGGVLRATGGIDFLVGLGHRLGGHSRAGPAQVAVISSGLMGMISGSTVANVASVGTLTIPMMKRYGFKPEFAGAVEAVASTGGQVTPPVMGLAAFLIVGITGIPYVRVMAAAAFPALIYYSYLLLAVHLRAGKVGLDARLHPLAAQDAEQRESLARALAGNAHILLGIAVLIYLLVEQMPPGTAAAWSVLTLLVMDVGKKLLLMRRTPALAVREAARVVVQGLEEGARSGAQVAIVIAVIAILVDMLTVTGFAQKLSYMMLDLAGNSLPLLLIIAAVTCLAFGLGLPTTASYILVALLGAPALTQLGVPLLAAHMFVFYFANVSALTPPVAVAALVASNIAEASFLRTALIAVRLGLPGFLLPFLFVARPAIMGLAGGFPSEVLTALIAFAGVIALNIALEGFLLTSMSWLERLLLLPAAFGLLDPGWTTTVAGALLFAAVAAWQVLAARRLASSAVALANPPEAPSTADG